MIIEMQPNGQQPGNSTPPGQFNSSQFDFIMNPQQQGKKSLLPSDPKTKLIYMVIGGGVGLVLLLFLIFGIFGGGGDPVDSLVDVAQQQNEIIRVSELASRDASGTQAQKLSAMVLSVVLTDQKNTVSYMSKNGKKVSAKDLALKQNKEADSQLSAAKQNGRFDEEYTQITLKYLQTYQQNLADVYPNLGEQGKEIIEQANDNVKLILQDNQVAVQ